MKKINLSESDIKAKFITPSILKSGWNEQTQLRREVYFTNGKINVNGQKTTREKGKFADYILFYKPNIPVAIIEAKSNKHGVKSGIQQALDYAEILDIPCVFSSNGNGFYFHDKTAKNGKVEKVRDLIQKCNDLEAERRTSEVNAQMLMQAVLKEAFAA